MISGARKEEEGGGRERKPKRGAARVRKEKKRADYYSKGGSRREMWETEKQIMTDTKCENDAKISLAGVERGGMLACLLPPPGPQLSSFMRVGEGGVDNT